MTKNILKPYKLLEKYKCGYRANIRQGGYYNFIRYKNEDCVIAYSVNDLGLFLLLKGKRKYFTFISLKDEIQGKELRYGGYENRLSQLEDINFIQLNNVIVVDEAEYKKYKDKMLLREL